MIDRSLPNLIVIGTMKSGTTALHYYLGLHPEISMSQPKELSFFVDQPTRETASCTLTRADLDVIGRGRGNWSRGVDWYAEHFRGAENVRGETSPAYTMPWYPDAASKMASVVPDAKLIFIVRDPIERAVSHYLTLSAAAVERRTLDVALSNPRGIYVSCSQYYAVLTPYLRRFSPENVLVVEEQALRHDRRKTMRSIYGFAGVDASFWSERLARERNPSTARPRPLAVERWLDRTGLRRRLGPRLPSELKWRIERGFLALRGRARQPELTPRLRHLLTAHLSDDARRLRDLTGNGFPTWSV